MPIRYSRKAAKRLLGQPVAGLLERLLPGQHFGPGNLAPVALLGDGGVDNASGRRPDVHARPVAFDKGDDGLVRDPKRPRPAP